MQPLVSVIILNWNGKKFLENCLNSIFAQSYLNIEIILVDNGSSDDSVVFVKEKYPGVRIIENKKNVGFATGNNIGIKAAKGEYIFVLNNDTKTDNDCIKHLVLAAENNEKIGMCAPKILSMGQENIIDSVGMNIYPDGMARGRARKEKDSGQYDLKKETLFASACAVLYRKKMLDQIGLFDDDFFIYCEDSDLGLRAVWAGWQAVFVPQARVFHWYSGTTESISGFKAFLAERNHFLLAIKNFPLRMLFMMPYYTAVRYVYNIRSIVTKKGMASNFKSAKFNLIIVLIKAYFSAFLQIPKTIRKRFAINKTKKISAKEFCALIKKHRAKISEITLVS